jgi:hypothetical protein
MRKESQVSMMKQTATTVVIKVAILSLSLGLPNIKNCQTKNQIICMQKTETDTNFDHTLLNFSGYNFENEINTH